MSRLVKIAETQDLSPGTSKAVEIEGRSIALFNLAGTFHAIDNSCTHVGGPLCEGDVNADTVTCPWHGAKFNIATGAVLGPPARQGVRSYPVTIQGNDVLVEVE